ncbi:glutathione S-transferase family protein [Pseudoalteromonas sp. T1lg65]|uniref:glutathione S-transferase family protein n=1 Tax=Pseudoalteromonas sp. T1lg65 TaxID=2077101 RepID=UPI003F7A935D
MKLVGSNTSPYARRLRMWILQQQLPVEYQHIDIFSDTGKAQLIAANPARKIPFLIDDDIICDSNLIARYLQDKYQLVTPSWQQENFLVTINACNDSLVELLLCQRSGFNTNEDKLFFNLQRERVHGTLQALNELCVTSPFLQCDYLQISLYCLLDWILFRELTEISAFSNLIALHNQWNNLEIAKNTNPRN